ncbi:hypothetical protein Aperf_G00000009904 [Anoplocephala perfoliata]
MKLPSNEKLSPVRPEPKGSRSASSDSSSSSAPPSIYLVATPIPADTCGSSSSSSSKRSRTRKGKEKDSSSSSNSSSSSSSSSSGVKPDGHTRVASKSPIVLFQVEPADFEAKSRRNDEQMKCKGRGDGRKKGGELISPAPQGSPPLPHHHQEFDGDQHQGKRSRSPGGRRDWGPPRSPPRGPPPGSPPPHHYPHPHPYHCHREFARHQQQQIRPKSMCEQSATEFETCSHIECGEVSDTRRSISNTSDLKGRQDKSRRQTPSPGPSFQPTSGLPQPEARRGKRNKPPKPLGEDEQMFIGSGAIYANK